MNSLPLSIGRRKITEDFIFLKSRAPVRAVPLPIHSMVERKIAGNHIYLEVGAGKPVIFCHGLFGGIYNVEKLCREIAKNYRFIMPYMPVYDQAIKECSVQMLGNYLDSFINDLQLQEAVVIGSSIGGGAALYSAKKKNSRIKGLVLCGSSGLSDIPVVKGFCKSRNYANLLKAMQDLFYNRSIPPEEMVQDVFNVVQDEDMMVRVGQFIKSANQNKMHMILQCIKTPALLIWGKQDPVAPIETALRFRELLPNSTLHVFNECGHLPTQEKPFQFLEEFFDFLKKINY